MTTTEPASPAGAAKRKTCRRADGKVALPSRESTCEKALSYSEELVKKQDTHGTVA